MLPSILQTINGLVAAAGAQKGGKGSKSGAKEKLGGPAGGWQPAGLESQALAAHHKGQLMATGAPLVPLLCLPLVYDTGVTLVCCTYLSPALISSQR